ncbi:MAG: DUF983 domain-containing protein [Flavobacteriales bacterium]
MTPSKAKLKSIISGKCPSCLQTNMFVEKNPYKLSKLSKMYDNCKVCGQEFHLEPGFYFGAMYITYVLVSGQFMVLFGLSYLFDFDLTIFQFMLVFLAVLVLLVPVNFRLSRLIWINFFVTYKPNISESKE